MQEKTLRRLHTDFDPQTFHTRLYNPRWFTRLYNPRWLPTPEEFILDLNVEVESLRMELLLSQPLPPAQYVAATTVTCDRYGVGRNLRASP